VISRRKHKPKKTQFVIPTQPKNNSKPQPTKYPSTHRPSKFCILIIKMNENDCPYEILGVSKDASDDEIRKAYRKLALKNHPDKQTTEEGKIQAQTVFAKIANAYEILSDPEEREQYDLRKKYGGAPGTRYTTTKSSPFGCGGMPQQTYTSQPRRTRTTTTSSVPCSGGGGPARTQYSQKDGKFTATVTREDGTTYTFMGTANGFQDPFEVFRKAFQDKTGEDFPDTMQRRKSTTTAGNKPTSTTTTRSVPMHTCTSMPMMQQMPQQQRAPVQTGTKMSTKIVGDTKVITKTETFPDGRTRTSVEEVPIHSTSGSSSTPKNRTTMKSTPTTTTTTTRRVSNPRVVTPTPMMQMQSSMPTTNSTGGSNGKQEVVGRSQKTRQVELGNGQVETITEITETFADGTTRTSSSSTIR
jgi:curved DNA-binding protein CbpA